MAHTNVIIYGGKTQAKSLASVLLSKKYRVTAISNDPSQCAILAQIKGLIVINGDGSQIETLENADCEDCDILIALGEHDADNLVVCEIAKKIFHVNKTISFVNDIKKTALFNRLGVDSVVCPSNAINTIIEQSAAVDKIASSVVIGEGRVRINEVIVKEDSPVIGKNLIEIDLPEQSIIGCILRGEQSIIPRGTTTIEANDNLLIISSEKDSDAAIRVITGK